MLTITSFLRPLSAIKDSKMSLYFISYHITCFKKGITDKGLKSLVIIFSLSILTNTVHKVVFWVTKDGNPNKDQLFINIECIKLLKPQSPAEKNVYSHS